MRCKRTGEEVAIKFIERGDRIGTVWYLGLILAVGLVPSTVAERWCPRGLGVGLSRPYVISSFRRFFLPHPRLGAYQSLT
jgi:hypothetical protein